jgi:lipopolysaccharide O-acetyltransferase
MPEKMGARLKNFFGNSLLDTVESLSELYWLTKTCLYYRRFFGKIGRRSRIVNPTKLRDVQHIFIGDEVRINKYIFLLTLTLHERPKPRIVINDGCVIGHMNHITCVNEVIIGKKVLTADGVHISDNSHVYSNPKIAIIDQGITSKGKVSIGDGSWIGENVSVLSCHIGTHCVIGSNSVVVNDIPDFSVAVGVPARVVRQFDVTRGQWTKAVRNRNEAGA